MTQIARTLPAFVVFGVAVGLLALAMAATPGSTAPVQAQQPSQPTPTWPAPPPLAEAEHAPDDAPWAAASRINDDPVALRQGAPAIAVDSTGSAYVVWEDERSGNRDIYFAYRPASASWSSPVLVNDDGSSTAQAHPAIALDGTGNAYALWQDERNGDPDVYFATRDNTGTWSANVEASADLSNTNQTAPAIAVDDPGNAYAVWADDRNGDLDIFFAYRPAAGPWDSPVQVSDAPSGTVQTAPAIAVDDSGNAYALWQDDRNGDPDIYFATRDITGTWSIGVDVSADLSNTNQISPSIAMDASGNAYAVWADDRNGDYDIYFAYRPAAGPWDSPVQVSDAPTATVQTAPAIAVDSAGNAYAAWQDLRDDFGDIYVAYRPAGGAWGASERINDDGGAVLQSLPALAMDGNGEAHAAWEDERDGNGDVFAARTSTTRAWSANQRVNDDPLAASQVLPDLVVDGTGNAYALWQDGRHGDADVYFAYRPSGGAWAGNVRVSEAISGASQSEPDLAVDGSGNAYALWTDDRNGDPDIYFATRDMAGTWSANVEVSADLSDTNQISPSIAVDSSGNAYAAWVDDRNGDVDIYFAYRPAAGAWDSPVQVSDAAVATAQTAPAIAVDSSGNAYALWQDDRNGDADIYFAYRPAGGPWGASILASDGPVGTSQAEPAITVDSSGNAYAIWTDDRNGDADIYFAYRPAGGAWQAAEPVSDAAAGTIQAAPDIAVDSKGNAYATWADDRDGDADIYFAYRPSYGAWGSNVRVNDVAGGSDQVQPAIATNAAGDAYVAWQDARDGNQDIYFSSASHAGIFNLDPWLAVNSTSNLVDGSTSSMAALEANPGANGKISLREALLAANNTAGEKRVTFAIPTSDPGYQAGNGAWTIKPNLSFPWLSSGQLTLDATTQGTSAYGGPAVVLDGSLLVVGAGLSLPGGNNTVRGFVVHSFPGHGIAIWSNDGNTVVGNYIGTDVTGTLDRGNGDRGISVGSDNNRIGGTAAGEGNVVAFNANQGVNLEVNATAGNTISRNAIFSNGFEGIRLETGANQDIQPPQILSVDEAGLAGTACAGCTVEIFTDDEDEGHTFEAAVIADGSGDWSWPDNPSRTGYHTATATDSSGNTSEFSAAVCSGDVGPNDVTISRFNDDDVKLDWTPNGSTSYQIWKGTQPYFTPNDGQPGTALQGTTTAPPFIVANVLGDPAVNHYFLVYGVSTCGGGRAIEATGYSNRTGQFDMPMVPGTP